jgi:hypothetical protein
VEGGNVFLGNERDVLELEGWDEERKKIQRVDQELVDLDYNLTVIG